MPKLNGTGPQGRGSGTGWGMGPCGGGFRGARGCRGRGFFGRFASSKEELSALEDEEKFLKEELKAIADQKILLKTGKN